MIHAQPTVTKGDDDEEWRKKASSGIIIAEL
jgi:hypothetical protein